MVSKFAFIANEFNGKRVLVTGGTAGIGKAVVTSASGRRSHSYNYCTRENNDDENANYEFVQANLSTSEGCTSVVKEVISH